MKLAGLTWWRNNYGSILQAYALQNFLNEFGCIEYEIICQYGKKIASFDNLADKIRTIGLIPSLKRIVWKFGSKKLRNRNRNIQKFVDENLKISKEQYNEDTIVDANKRYDGFVCGSDQIWNPVLSPLNSMYWLTFAEDSKLKLSYAPSIGVDRVTEEQTKIIRQNLSQFDAVSCREECGTKLINGILKKEVCSTVLDPTLLVDVRMWDCLSENRKFEFPYVFTYMLRGNKRQRQLVEEFAKRKGLKIVTIPFLEADYIESYDFKFGHIKLWEASPQDFINAIRYAEYVFTDSYHCMIFSCIYHREFFIFPKTGKAQMNRLMDFQNLLHISNRILYDGSIVEDMEGLEQISWNRVDQSIREKRELSRNYLRSVIKENADA